MGRLWASSAELVGQGVSAIFHTSLHRVADLFACGRLTSGSITPITIYLINRYKSYGAVVFLNYTKNASKEKKKLNIYGAWGKALLILVQRVMASAIFLSYAIRRAALMDCGRIK